MKMGGRYDSRRKAELVNHPNHNPNSAEKSASTDLARADLRQRFESALHSAVVCGQSPSRFIGVGPRTLAAVTAIAAEHPDASADLIAAAYDTFLREHR